MKGIITFVLFYYIKTIVAQGKNFKSLYNVHISTFLKICCTSFYTSRDAFVSNEYGTVLL